MLKPVLLFAAAMLVAGPAFAQNVNVRGTVTAFDGKVLEVKTREGSDVKLELPADMAVAATKPFTLADLKPGMVLGVTTVRRGDDVVAIDVRPIPPAARRGLSPFDLAPESTMTNAVMEGAVAAGSNASEITLNYGDGMVKVKVPPGTPMSQAVPGERSDIKPGETVFVSTRREADGKLTPLRIQVSKDGVKPTQ